MEKRCVLVADDHKVTRGFVRSMFEARGFEVSDAEDGAQAVEKAQKLHPDLVVLDLSMPVMNGLEAARTLKVTMPSLPLLMFTNHIGSILQHEAQAAGISAVVSKTESAFFFHADALLQTTDAG